MSNNLFDYFLELERKRREGVPTSQLGRFTLGAPPVQPQQPFNPFIEQPVADERITLVPPDRLHPNQDAMQKYGGITPSTDKEPVKRDWMSMVNSDLASPSLDTRPVLSPPDAVPVDELAAKEEELRRLRDFQNNPVENNDKGFWGRLGDIGRQLVISGGDAYRQARKSGASAKEALAEAGGGAVAGGLYGGFHPQADEERQRLYDIAKNEQDVGRIKLNREWETNQAAKKAQTENIKHDNLLASEREARIKKEQILKRLTKNGFDPANVSEADKRDLEDIGLTPDQVGKINIAHPTLRSVGGINYAWNPTKGAFEATNLPTDVPQEFTEITVTDINGIDSTYTVPKVKAAEFKTQMSVIGAQVKREEIKTQSDVKRRNYDRKVSYEKAINENKQKRGKLAGEVSALDKTVGEYEASNATKNTEIANLQAKVLELGSSPANKSRNESEINEINSRITKLRSEIEANDERWRDAKQQRDAKKSEMDSIADPSEPVYEDENITLPTVSGSTGKVATKSQVEAFAKSKGISYEEALKKAQADGYTVQ